jgi:hypothetical protein
MKNPDHNSESLINNFYVKILGWKKIGSGIEKSRIRDKHPGSAPLIKFVKKNPCQGDYNIDSSPVLLLILQSPDEKDT